MQSNFQIVDINNSNNAQAIINSIAAAGGGICVVLDSVQKGRLFETCPHNVLVLDFRYGGASLLRGNQPRSEGRWIQYAGLDTGLARNMIVSDSITNDTPIQKFDGSDHRAVFAPVKEFTLEEYGNMHNHYQNFLSEVFNYSDHLNGVAIWGDSAALVPGARSWGAFFSARSWPLQEKAFTPPGTDYDIDDFDASLIGVEVDVLNSGRDWDDPSPRTGINHAKVGVQVVGFGKRNTTAIEVRTEDTDDFSKAPEERRGAWRYGIVVRNALHHYSTLLHDENGTASRGLDLSRTNYTDGALLISPNGSRSGVRFGIGTSGEIYGEKDGTLVVAAGNSGIRFELGNGEYFSFSPERGVEMSKLIRDSLSASLSEANKETSPTTGTSAAPGFEKGPREEEVNHWEQFIKSEAFVNDWCSAKPNPNLEVEIDLLLKSIGMEMNARDKTISVLDVASGPCSILSNSFTEINASLKAADASANEFEKLWDGEREFPVCRPIACAAEELARVFGPRAFDVTHIRNALGHSENPITVIHQMIQVTKPSGYIIIHGIENNSTYGNWHEEIKWSISAGSSDLVIKGRCGADQSVADIFAGFIKIARAWRRNAGEGKTLYGALIQVL